MDSTMNKLNLDDAFPLHINVLVINYEFNVVAMFQTFVFQWK